MLFNEKRAASIKDSLLDMLLGDPSTRHVRPNPTRSLAIRPATEISKTNKTHV